MYSIGTIAAAAASGVDQISAHLPWGWFTLMGLLDLGLIAVIVSRRLGPRRAAGAETRAHQTGADALVLRSGWWVPRSRALAVPQHQGSFAWPLHREYMISRVV